MTGVRLSRRFGPGSERKHTYPLYDPTIDSLAKEDAITKEILERHIITHDGWWESLEDGALYFTAEGAITAKMATRRGSFAPGKCA